MAKDAVSQVYARALYESALSSSEVETIHQQLQDFAGIWEGEENFQVLFLNPSVPAEDKEAFLDKAMANQCSPLFLSFLKCLVSKDRFAAVPGIAQNFQELVDEAAGVIRATVTTAVPLNDQQKQSLSQALSQQTAGKQVALDEEIQADLLGGFAVRMEDQFFDATVARSLEKLAKAMGDQPLADLQSAWQD